MERFNNVCVTFDYRCPACKKFNHIVMPDMGSKIKIGHACQCGRKFNASLHVKKGVKMFIVKMKKEN